MPSRRQAPRAARPDPRAASCRALHARTGRRLPRRLGSAAEGREGWETIPGPLPAGGRDLRLDQRLCDAIEGPAASPCYQAPRTRTAEHRPSMARRSVEREPDRPPVLALVPVQRLQPDHPAGRRVAGARRRLGVGLGDPRPSGRPLLVALSRHCAGARRAWARSPKRGSRPLVHVALGSHANYFGAGTFPHDPACWPRELRDVVRALKLVDPRGQGSHGEAGPRVRSRRPGPRG